MIVIDRVVGSWGHQLRWPAFSVRVAESDVDRLPEILTAIPPKKISRMQRAAAAVWRRFAWLSHPVLLRRARELQQAARLKAAESGAGQTEGRDDEEAQQAVWARGQLGFGEWQDDAFGTIMQWLYHKLQQRQGAAAGGEGGAAAAGEGRGGGQLTRWPQRGRRKKRRRRGGDGVVEVQEPGEADDLMEGGPAGVV